MKRKYSLIFMTDQGKTSRMRMGSGALRFLVILCIALPLLLGGTLWAGWELLQRYSALRAENAALRAKLAEQDDIITRLGNLEQFLRVADPDLLRRVLGPAYVSAADTPAAGERAAQAGADAALPSTESPDASAEALAAGAVESTEHTAAENVTSVPDSSAPRAAETPVPLPPPVPVAEGSQEESVRPNLPPLDEIPLEKTDANQPVSALTSPADAPQLDKGIAELKNMKARRVGMRTLRISLDLYNTAQGKQLSGKVEFELVLADGTKIPLTGGGDTSYRINRLKKIISNPTLPANIGDLEGAGIRVNVYAGDELIYSGSIPIQE